MGLLLHEVDRRVDQNTHPGLQLDKYTAPAAQEQGKQALEKVVGVARQDGPASARRAFDALRRRRTALLEGTKACPILATCRTPLTLHLARASALENAGIALHRTGGFPVLPGTGVKGMARAYAELVARAGQEDDIRRVFGPRLGPNDSDEAEAGTVVFHDGWPVGWPNLLVDITNSHHADYYRTAGDEPPGDWDGPIPVYFLAVAAGTKFEFAVGPRDVATSDADVALAATWLRGALTHLGAGAKTAAGYGWMDVADAPGAARGEVVRHKLELLTPAFLAGASQQKGDCDLRSSTLRGLLRWWWRTMHVGFLDSRDLYRLEGAIFGSTADGQSAFEVVVTPNGRVEPLQAQYRDRTFEDRHGIRARRVAAAGGRMKPVGTGIAYAAYGMADGHRAKNPRWVIEPGASWTVELRFHASRRIAERKERHALNGKELPTTLVRREVESALFLLCRFGAFGAKARKGFGSVATPTGLPLSLEDARRLAAETRQALGLQGTFNEAKLRGACSLERLAQPTPGRVVVDAALPLTDRWAVMDRVGQLLQDGAADWAHREDKLALGLPRSIHGPKRDPMPHQDRGTHRNPEKLRGPGRADRHSSPVHVSVDRGSDGKPLVRVLAFVAGRLPTPEKSAAFLQKYLVRLEERLGEPVPDRPSGPRSMPPRGGQPPAGGRDFGGRGPRPESVRGPGGPTQARQGDEVEIELLEEKTKKGGWRGRLVAHPDKTGVIENGAEVPEAQPGQRVRAIVKSIPVGKGDWTFRYKK